MSTTPPAPTTPAALKPTPFPLERQGSVITFGPDRETPIDLHIAPGGGRAAYTRSLRQPDGSTLDALFVVDLQSLDSRTLLWRTGWSAQPIPGQPSPMLPYSRVLFLADWVDDQHLAVITEQPGRHVATLEVIDASTADRVARTDLPASMTRAFTMVRGRKRLVIHDYPGKAWEIDLADPVWPARRMLFDVRTEHKYSDAVLFRDGKSFFYLAKDGLYIGDTSGRDVRRVAAGDSVGFPATSPDGQRLAAAVATPGGRGVPLRREGPTIVYGDRVVVTNAAGEIVAEHVARSGRDDLYALGPWAPDGSVVLLSVMRRTGCLLAGMDVEPHLERRGLLIWTPGSEPRAVADGLERMEVETRFAGPDRLFILTRPAPPPAYLAEQPTPACRERAAAAEAERARAPQGVVPEADPGIQVYDVRSGTLRDDPTRRIPLPVSDPLAAGLDPDEAVVVDPSGEAYLLMADGRIRNLGWRAAGRIGTPLLPGGFLSARGESGYLIVALEDGDARRVLLVRLREAWTPTIPSRRSSTW